MTLNKDIEATMQDSFKNIGSDLKSARLESGLQVDEISQLLNIPKANILRLEDGDFESLPGRVYVSGYLRSVARTLGMDDVEVTRRYSQLLEEQEKKPSYSFPADNREPKISGAKMAAMFAALAIILYGGWYLVGPSGDDGRLDSQDIAAQNTSPASEFPEISTPTPVPEETPSQTASNTRNRAGNRTVGSASSNRVAKPGIRVAKPGIPKKPAETSVAGAARTRPAVRPAPQDIKPEPNTTPSSGVAFAGLRQPNHEIKLRAVDSSWVELIRNNGEQVKAWLMERGDTYIVDSRDKLYLSTGNAGGLELILPDGEVISIGRRGDVIRDIPLDIERLEDQL